MEKGAISTEVVDGSIKVVDLSKQLETMKEEMSFIKAKVQFYDKYFFVISLLVVFISCVIALSFIQ